MESILKYRIVLLKEYEDNSMATSYLEWACNDAQLDDQKEATPNAKCSIFKSNEDLLFIYTNRVDATNPLAAEQAEFVDSYIETSKREASLMNHEFILVDNTTGGHQEQLLFEAMDTNMKSYYKAVWQALGKTESQINELSKVYTSAALTAPIVTEPFEIPEETPEESGNDNQDIEDTGIVKEDKHINVGTENEGTSELTDRELLVTLLNKVNSLEVQIKELKEIIANPDTKTEVQIQEKPEEQTEPEKSEDLTDDEFLGIRNYAADAEKEHKDVIDDIKPEEGVPVVQPTNKAVDATGNADVGGLYQNAVFYPKNPVKKEQIENQPPQISQTDTETIVGDMPDPEDRSKPISTSQGNESKEETVIYNSVDKTETLWETILDKVGTESDLSALIVENYNELPKSVQDDFLRFNMFDKYKNGKTTTLSKVEAVKRKVKVKQI